MNNIKPLYILLEPEGNQCNKNERERERERVREGESERVREREKLERETGEKMSE